MKTSFLSSVLPATAFQAGLMVGALALSSSSATAQALLYQIVGDAPGDRLGGSLDRAGDVDGDGFDDFIVGALCSSGSCYARVYSGADGSTLFDLDPALPGAFTHAVAGGGDVNGDGVPDFAVGLPREDTLTAIDAGKILVYSGANGSVLYTLEGEAAQDLFGGIVSLAETSTATD